MVGEEVKKGLKYAPWILGAVGGIIALYFLYKFFSKAKDGAETAADYATEMTVYEALSKKIGIPVNRIVDCHAIALEISRTLETNKDMSWTDKATHVVYDSDILKTMKRPKDEKEMLLVSSFYAKEFTNDGKLYDDLKEALNWASDLASIPHISIIS